MIPPKYLICSVISNSLPLNSISSMLCEFSVGRFLVCPMFRSSGYVLSLFNVTLLFNIHLLNSFIILFTSAMGSSFDFALNINIK